jgi:hypothetical protein
VKFEKYFIQEESIMLVAISIIAVAATLLSIYLWLQLYNVTLRALYWEREVKQDSLIRHQWLQSYQPTGFRFKVKSKSM